MNKRGAFQGLNKVYKFTLYQLYKNKANLATFGIFIAVALFAIPVMSFFMGSGSTEGASFYTQVMTMDEFMGLRCRGHRLEIFHTIRIFHIGDDSMYICGNLHRKSNTGRKIFKVS